VLFATGRLEQLPDLEPWVATVATERFAWDDLRGYRLETAIPHPLSARLGSGITLHGYALSQPDVHPGDTLTVKLFWGRDGPVQEDYHVFVHVADQEGHLWGQHDGPPLIGAHPTDHWPEGVVLPDVHTIEISPEVPSGRYRLMVGMYGWPSLERLPAVRADGTRWPDDRILLTELAIATR